MTTNTRPNGAAEPKAEAARAASPRYLDRTMKFYAFGTTWLIGWHPSLRFSVSNREYWRRWVIGPIYVLRWWPAPEVS